MAATYEAIIALVGQMDPSLKKATDQAKRELEALERKAGKSGAGSSKAMRTLGKVAGKAMQGLAAGTAAAATGIGVLAKQSVQAYAENEQLVGGVEKLFGDSSKQVLGYAEEAYKAAGMSGNDYMQTVTAFSASLIRSLGGDTAKAAEYANTAITDMSDNANTFGTDMEMLQRTYQSLARGNFGMLDNLALGFSGTKQGGQELIDQANEIRKAQGKSADLQIDRYADIVEAIHTVQESMHISGLTAEEAAEAVASGAMTQEEAYKAMGTTAREAMTTIEGSMKTAGAAWDNWVEGLADPDKDMGELTDRLLESVQVAAENIMPRVSLVLDRLGPIVQERAPQIIQGLATALPALAGDLIPAGAQLAVAIITGIVMALPALAMAVVGALSASLAGIGGILEQSMGTEAFRTLAVVAGIAAGALLAYKVAAMATQGVSLALAAAQYVLNAAMNANPIMIVVTLVGALVGAFIALYNTTEWFRNAVDGVIQWLGNLGQAIYDALDYLGPFGDVLQAIADAIGFVADGIGSFVGGIADFFTGGAAGADEMASSVDNAASSIRQVPSATQYAASSMSGSWSSLGADMTASLYQVPEAASSAVSDTQSELDQLRDIKIDPQIDTSSLSNLEIPESYMSSLKDLSNYEVPTFDTSSLSGMTADYSGIVSGAQDARSQVASTFSGLGDEISAAISSGVAGAGNSFTAIVMSAQSSATSVTTAFGNVGTGIGAAILAALAGATAGFTNFASVGTSSATQVMSAHQMAAMMIMSIWTMALAMVAARALATVSAFFQMSAAGVSAASAISGSMAGVAGNISGITSSAYAAVGALNAMASAARSASAAAATANAARAVGFAHGGFTSGPSVAGEDPRYPTEAVISFNPAYRSQNRGYLIRAAQMLGMSASSVAGLNKDPWTLGGELANSGAPVTSNYELATTVNVGGITFAPKIEVKGNASRDDIVAALRRVEPEFRELVRDVLADGEVGDYAFDAS